MIEMIEVVEMNSTTNQSTWRKLLFFLKNERV